MDQKHPEKSEPIKKTSNAGMFLVEQLKQISENQGF